MKSSPSEKAGALKYGPFKEILWVLLIFVELFVLLNEVPWLSRWFGTTAIGPTTAPIGVVQSTQSSVQVQSPWDLSWQVLEPRAQIHESQSVWTGPDSTLSILLDDGVEVMVSENTMLQFRKRMRLDGRGSVLAIHMVKGRAQARRVKPAIHADTDVVIESEQKSIPVTTVATDIQKAVDVVPEAIVPAKVDKPTPKPIPPKRVARPLKSSPTPPPPPPPPSGGDNRPEFIRKKPRSQLPGLMQRLWAKLLPSALAEARESWIIRLKWNAVQGVQKYQIQISPTRDFNTIQIDTNVHASRGDPKYEWAFEPGMEGQDGKSYYRIASVATSSEGDIVGAFTEPREVVFPDEVIRRVQEIRAEWRWSGDAAIHTGVSNQVQFNSDPGFSSVRMQSVYLSQRIKAGLEYANDEHRLSLVLNYIFAGFHKPSTTQTTLQPDVFGYTGDLSAWWSRKSEHSATLAYGLIAARDYRWVKEGVQTVLPVGAVSFGPAIAFVRNYEWGVWDASLGLPLIGGSQGLVLRSGIEMRFPKVKWLRVRGEFEGRASLWSVPNLARYGSWSVWLAPVIAWQTR